MPKWWSLPDLDHGMLCFATTMDAVPVLSSAEACRPPFLRMLAGFGDLEHQRLHLYDLELASSCNGWGRKVPHNRMAGYRSTESRRRVVYFCPVVGR